MINLLPEKEKQILLIEKKRRVILILNILIFLFLLSLSLVLIAINSYVGGQVRAEQTVVEQVKKDFESSVMSGFPQEIDSANQIFSSLNNFYRKKLELAEVFEKIYNLLPENLYLRRFSYQRNTSQIIISGFAKTRDDLLKFQENLQNSPDIDDVSFPPSVWLESENINFDVSFALKK